MFISIFGPNHAALIIIYYEKWNVYNTFFGPNHAALIEVFTHLTTWIHVHTADKYRCRSSSER